MTTTNTTNIKVGTYYEPTTMSEIKADAEEAIAEAEAEERIRYDAYTLEAFLGEFIDEYDVEAIEDEITARDINGNQVWNREYSEQELFEIAERHTR